ncbi:MAG: type III polyketide synthase [Thermoplasmatota archaeon]
MPRIAALAHAVPENRVLQTEMRDLAALVLADHAPLLSRLVSVFDNAGIQQRFFVEPLDWYLAPHGWKDRSEKYLVHAMDLALRAARDALAKASLAATDIDGILVVSTTGIATPSLDARLAGALGCRPDVLRIPLWGLGCAGGVAGLARGADIVRSRPDARILVVTVEVCSLAFQFGEFTKQVAVAATLFGDGAAAAVVQGDAVRGGGVMPRVTASRSHLFPDSTRVMGWDIEEYGLAVVFSPEIPSRIEASGGALIGAFLKDHAAGHEPDRWLFHPGGAKVVTAYEKTLSLPHDALDETRGVLRDFGNLSSPTVLFVAERSLAAKRMAPGERALLAALGPGFASELLLIEGPVPD